MGYLVNRKGIPVCETVIRDADKNIALHPLTMPVYAVAASNAFNHEIFSGYGMSITDEFLYGKIDVESWGLIVSESIRFCDYDVKRTFGDRTSFSPFKDKDNIAGITERLTTMVRLIYVLGPRVVEQCINGTFTVEQLKPLLPIQIYTYLNPILLGPQTRTEPFADKIAVDLLRFHGADTISSLIIKTKKIVYNRENSNYLPLRKQLKNHEGLFNHIRDILMDMDNCESTMLNIILDHMIEENVDFADEESAFAFIKGYKGQSAPERVLVEDMRELQFTPMRQ